MADAATPTDPAPPSDAAQGIADLMAQFGMPELAAWILEHARNGTDPTTILMELRKTDAYKRRFPAMEDLQKQAIATGRGYTEGDYIEIENAYREVLSSSGLPTEFWDTADDFANLMRGQVAPTEVQARVDAARKAVLSTEPSTRTQMLRLYGITTQDLMAYALVPDKGADHIERMATSAIMAGYGADAGLGSSLGREQWEHYAGEALQQGMDLGEVRSTISAAARLLDTQSRLAEIEGNRFTGSDALDIGVSLDAAKTTASEKRARRESARFSGRSGLSTGTLGSSGV